MHAPDLPEPIAAYFAADRRDGRAVAQCFTDDAVVRDEGREHAGAAAIEAWKTAASARYRYTAEPLGIAREDDSYLVRARVSGDFPGSPAELRYRFRLAGERIVSLEVGG